jgi:hypothetical protein
LHEKPACDAGIAACLHAAVRGSAEMTGMYEQTRPGLGHNQPDEYAEEKKHQKWERWAKKRTFVRAHEGTYSHLYKALL